MIAHISERKRDHYREKLFKDAYGLDAQIHVVNHNDEDWNWEIVAMEFRDRNGKDYSLIEHYHEGDNNDTKFVILEYNDGKYKQKKFDRFVDAEKAMADLMRQSLGDKDGNT